MMGKRSVIAVSLVALMSFAPTSAFATDAPSPQASPSASHLKQILTQTQKVAIVAARVAFSLARSNAQNGFDRAIADAKAIRDQAIASAGTDANSIRLAKKNYNDSYKIILRAYKSDLNAARTVLKNALSNVRASK
jgi:hypothetical protein